MKNIKSLKMHCEISERITWAKRTAKMIFVTVPYHSDRKYTRENPYVSYVRIDDGFCPAERGFKVSFSATACEYDNFKSIVLETKEKNFKIEFHEDGEIYFDGVSTAYCYDIDKWYDFELFFGKGMVLKINNRAVVKTEDCPDSIRQICLEIVGYPTYGPILQSSIGICGLEYSLDRVDFDSIDTSRPDYQLKAEKDDIESVAQALTYDVIAAMDQGKDKVRHSLNFTESGFPDIQICYRAEDEKYITKSGRVIRPKSWEGDKTVGVTAEISDGIHTIIKHFTFTIAKQEDFSDPQDMPDQEFFGIFSDGVWKREGKLDYTKLPEVLEAVKNGDYALAKTLLFTHFQNKHFPKEENLPFDQAEEKTAFDAGYAEMVLNNFHQLQQGYLLGVMDTTAQKAHMNTSLIKANSTMTFSIRAMHNESSAFLLLDTPVLTVRTNKRMLHYPAVETAMIRAGEYRHTALGADERKAEMYGEFLGNRTSYILVKFEIYGIGQREKILFAELGVQGKVVPETAGEKRLIVVKEFSNTWNSKSVKFCDLLYSVYSYEGLHDVNKWGKPPFADGEYLWQSARFPFYGCVLNEYEKTKDTELLYGLQKNIEEAIMSFGGFRSESARYTYAENGIRGGYTRTLDASAKFNTWVRIFTVLVKSPYCSSEFAIAFLKAIWDTQNYLLSNCDRRMGNWTEFIFRGILMAAGTLKEFKREFNGEDWLDACHAVYEKTVKGCFFPDGSYREGNSGYCQTALDNYIRVQRKLTELGREVSADYRVLIHKNAWYCANLFTADGSSLVYGDCINYRREDYNNWDRICEMTGDAELKYLVTYGKEGKAPPSTLYHSPESRLTVMRSDFGANAVYLFTDVRGGGGHSHCDENSIILAAYGKTLLCDSGVFSYSMDDPYRVWGMSTRAHNTVEVDGKNQQRQDLVNAVSQGEIHEVSDNREGAKVVQTSYAYPECAHKRSIVFVKPDFFLVKDEMFPTDGKPHTYDVLWHFLPKSNAVLYGEICETCFENSANIKIITIGEAENSLENGFVDLSYGQVETAKYLRTRMKGNSVITLLIPEKQGISRNIIAEIQQGKLVVKEKERILYMEE